jgi:hypothetical protein
MNARGPMVGAWTLGLCSAALTGCGCLVSESEYLAKSRGESASFTVTDGAATDDAVQARAAARSGARAKPVAIVTRQAAKRDAAAVDKPASSSYRLYYESVARSKLEALHRELALLTTRAELKGAPALAAIEPGVRDFNSSVDLMEDSLWRASGARNADDWSPAAHAIAHHLHEASEAVRDAAEAVFETPSPTRD